MITVSVEPTQNEALALVQGAINAQVARLELALQAARSRVLPFEQKYRIPSSRFLAQFVVEDLEGGEDEYLSWAGEYRLYLRLQEKLDTLKKQRVVFAE
mgnify:CR=1 FL=1